jgi:hypothetical protein
MVASRNTVSDFLDRTLRNLDKVDKEVQADPHAFFEVTQLINSAIGMLIFPYEGALDHIPETPISDIIDVRDMPSVLHGEPGEVKTLRALFRKMRHSIAHFNVHFQNYNGQISGIYFWTYPATKAAEPDFVMYMPVDALKRSVVKAGKEVKSVLKNTQDFDRLEAVEKRLGKKLRFTNPNSIHPSSTH